MKANELMIGDWVNYRPGWIDEDSGKVVYESGTGFPVRVEFIYNCRGGEGLIQYNDGENDGIEAAEYELFPIPITPEILEKNGFIVRTAYTVPKWHIGLYGRDDSDITLNIYSEKKQEWRLSIETNRNERTVCYINNIHELQHALRLCGINKEIIL